MTSVTAAKAARGRPKGDKRARTRAKLLAAARELIREEGYERTTLAAVASRAGMTSGAIYGNFKNRDDLFLTLAQTGWSPIKPEFSMGSSFAQKMRALAEATVAAIPERRSAAVGRLTGLAHAIGHEATRAELQATTATSFKAGAAWLRAVADEGGLPMPAEVLVCVIQALTEGLLLQRFLTPELVPDDVFYAAFAALAGGQRAQADDSGH
jgi:AcrR family transcriptional regulator